MIIGLTGKSCSGKNIAAIYMQSLGWKVLDLDEVGHVVLENKNKEVEEIFGTSQRKELGRIVFSNPEKLKQLESILFPEIIASVFEAEKDNKVVVANGALLYRCGLDRLCKHIIYIDASYPVRLMRALARDSITEKEFKMRDDAQTDVDYRDVTYKSDLIVIDNEVDCTEQLRVACKKISLDLDTL